MTEADIPTREADALAVVSELAALSRPPASEGERIGAELLAAGLARRGTRVRIEPERVQGTYWEPIGICSLLAALSGLAGRRVAAVGGLLTALTIADDLDVGRRPLRRLLKQRTAHNVVAEVPGEDPGDQTLVIHAHHDAARTGVVLGSRRLRLGGAALSAGFAAAMANIAFSRAVPGANDNLSGVAVLLKLAETLSHRPPRRLRVILLSTGSEESFLEAMVRFGERHFDAIPRSRTTFLCLESVGSPHLMLLSGEGLLRLRRYPGRLIDILTKLAAENEVPLRKPFRYRLATDGQVPLLAGYPVAVISSMDWYKAPSNYHWPTDRPENLDTDSIAGACRLAEAFVRELDREPAVDAQSRTS